MFEEPVLLYSNHCAYSEKFINIITQNKMNFIKLNIDANANGIRNPDFYNIQEALRVKITEVPTIIVKNEGENYVLSGEEAFKWLEYQLKTQNTQSKQIPQELTGFNSNEMGSFSDQYSNFGSNGLFSDAKDQSFVFLDKQYDKMTTNPEDTSTINQVPKEREQFTQPQTQQAPTQGFYGTTQNYKEKPKDETSKRYEELMAQRQMVDGGKAKPQQINFATGEII